MREHRIVGLIFLSLCYMMMSVACSYEPKPPVVAPPPTLPPTTEPEPVTTIWAFWGDPWEVEIHERVIAVFEADHPHINSRVQRTGHLRRIRPCYPCTTHRGAIQSLHGSATSP